MTVLNYGGFGASSYEFARRGLAYTAYASGVTPVVYSTAAGTGGPLLWNGSYKAGVKANTTAVNLVLIGASCVVTTAATAACSIGLTGNSGQAAAPTSTTAITGLDNNLFAVNAGNPQASAYNKGTVSSAGIGFLPLFYISTAALSANPVVTTCYVDLGGKYVVPPGGWVSLASSAAADATLVLSLALEWVEVPVP